MSIDIEPTTILGPSEGIGEHPAVNLTHNTKGSAWNKIGNNKLIGVDQFRHNYNPLTGIYEGRTLMGQWTNEIQDPRDMTTGNWGTVGDVSVTRNQVGIDGVPNTACLIEDIGSAAFIEQDISIPDNSNTHTGRIQIKKDSSTKWDIFRILIRDGTTQVDTGAFIRASDGAINPFEDSTISDIDIEDNGRYWAVTVKSTNNSTGNTRLSLQYYPAISTDGINIDNSLTGSSIIDAVEVFLNRSSPPPTPVYGEVAGQSYTQDPDIATVTDLDAINFNPQEGTIIVEYSLESLQGNVEPIWSLNDGSGSERFTLFGDLGNGVTSLIYSFNGSQVFQDNFTTAINGAKEKIAISYSSSGWSIARNGNIEDTGTESVDLSNVTQVNIGSDHQSRFMNGFMPILQNYPRRLSNEDLIQETTL